MSRLTKYRIYDTDNFRGGKFSQQGYEVAATAEDALRLRIDKTLDGRDKIHDQVKPVMAAVRDDDKGELNSLVVFRVKPTTTYEFESIL